MVVAKHIEKFAPPDSYSDYTKKNELTFLNKYTQRVKCIIVSMRQ